MSPFDWFLVAWWIFGATMVIARVGKPQKPTQPGAAAVSTLITLGLIAGLLVTRGVTA